MTTTTTSTQTINPLDPETQPDNGGEVKDWSGYELVVTCEFNAPRWLVFRTWVDPVHLARWWGPQGFTNPVCELDVRPGGRIYIVMRGPDGNDYPMAGEYREIVEPERLVFTAGALDGDGNLLFELLKTIIFEEREVGKTTLTATTRFLRSTGDVSQYLDGHKDGFTQSLDGLEAYIKECVASAEDNARAPGDAIV